ncbi:MAG: PHP domain protein, partial [Candidatus Magasanikbacteria bacterium GW2011_GWA2_43_9]
CQLIPAHAWTPWFGIFGSKGGYDSLDEAFDELASEIFAIETGLSSDPLMNWHWSHLDRIAMISNSDAHSPAKLGREANMMQFASEDAITYDEIFDILKTQDSKRFVRTVEFYPEEGKYHMDGHRDCNISFHPDETKKHKGICPKCKKPLVIGVMNRVIELSDRTEEEAKEHGQSRVPYTSLVPLVEILADTLQKGWATKTVQAVYHSLIAALGSEFHILLEVSLEDIEKASTKQIATAIDRVRKGNIFIKPGYDGEFGIVKVFANGDERGVARQQGLDLM